MRTPRPFRPHADALDPRMMPSTVTLHPGSHATAKAAQVVHLGGKHAASARVEGELKSGKPEYVRIVATADNRAELTISSAGGEAKAAVSLAGAGGAAIIDSGSTAGDAVTVGKVSARSISVLVEVEGHGRFTLDVAASKATDVHVPVTGTPVSTISSGTPPR